MEAKGSILEAWGSILGALGVSCVGLGVDVEGLGRSGEFWVHSVDIDIDICGPHHVLAHMRGMADCRKLTMPVMF